MGLISLFGMGMARYQRFSWPSEVVRFYTILKFDFKFGVAKLQKTFDMTKSFCVFFTLMPGGDDGAGGG